MKNLIKKITPSFLLDFYHYSLAAIGAFLYAFPSRYLKVIGITGTSGKSTVVEMATKILEEAGLKTASLSSIRFKIGEKEWQNKLKMTMPGRFKIQKFLRQAVRAGCQYAILEVTSEGIKQFRHKFIDFEIALLTNLSPEHIEVHGGFEKYRAAKGKLFEEAKKIHIINLDDENAKYFWEIPAEKKIGYGLKLKAQNSKVKAVVQSLKLLGEFNIYNALAAVEVAVSQGVSLEVCQKALEKIKEIPGRMEIVIKEPFKVIVDYAHTPEELKNVYETLKGAKLLCVLGACGGGRDKWKRPAMAKIASQYCSEVVITNEDPYDENPTDIIEQVAAGAGDRARKILDRREAIREALKLAVPGDVVVVTGKGCEPWLCVAKGKKIPWDDRKIVKEEYEKRGF